jgi:glutamate synthase domain-containing protein 1
MDMVIELLMTGRLPEVMMMVPEAWENTKPCLMTILQYNACIMSLGMACLYSV